MNNKIVYVAPEVHAALKVISAKRRTTMERLTDAVLRDFIEKSEEWQ